MRYHRPVTYQVLARTWRPQRFADLIGQEAVVRTLQNALSSEKFGQAYLFSGLRGVGKTTAARLLAKAVNCEQGPTAEPCGECVSCREITSGSSVDVIEIDGATNTQVDKVRDLQDLLRFRPTRDRFRVIVIDEVHMLSTSAFNALLKSIEEPPPYVLWIFATTERHKVPATILSRCQELDFRPLPVERLASHLSRVAEGESLELSAAAAGAIARAAEGSVRDALSLLDQLRAFSGDRVDEAAVEAVLGVPPLEQTVRLVRALAEGDLAAALTLLREQLARGQDPSVLSAEVGRVLRVLLHLAVAPELETGLGEDLRGELAEVARGLGAVALGRMLGLWLEQAGLMRDAVNRELALEVAALRLARWPAVQRLEALLAADPGVAADPPAVSPPKAPAAPAAGDPPPAGGSSSAADPGSRLAEALWSERPRLAGAVEASEVRVEQRHLVLRFAAAELALARHAESERTRLEAAVRHHLPGLEGVRIEVEAVTDGGLERVVADDPQVQLALEVLGGEVVAIRPDESGR